MSALTYLRAAGAVLAACIGGATVGLILMVVFNFLGVFNWCAKQGGNVKGLHCWAPLLGALLPCVFLIAQDLTLPDLPLAAALFAFLAGTFLGILSSCLTEVIDGVPLVARRTTGFLFVRWLLLAVALGRVSGSLLYWLFPGFY